MSPFSTRLEAIRKQLVQLNLNEGSNPPPAPDGGSDEALLSTIEALAKTALDRSHRAAQERRLFEHGPVVVFRWRNSEGWPVEYVSPNVVELTGHALDDFRTGKLPYSNIIAKDDLGRVGSEVATFSQKGVPWFEHAPYRIVHADGRELWVTDYTVVVRDESGTITHYYGYIFDITSRHELLLRQAEALKQLGAPVLSVWKGVLALPLVGHLDAQRANRILEVLLGAVTEKRARVAILDLTGVDVVDRDTAGHLIKLVQAVALLGADCVLSGISPTVAHLFIEQAVDLKGVRAFSTLEDALAYGTRRTANGR
ncbi:MAG: PAS domain-containing protein [Polyangiaceae bacterium]|nr:PAS domain-containing protein [Polyangiaceae bacterium]